MKLKSILLLNNSLDEKQKDTENELQKAPDSWQNILQLLTDYYELEEYDSKQVQIENDLEQFIREINNDLTSIDKDDGIKFQKLIWRMIEYIGMEIIKSRYSEYSKGDYFKETVENIWKIIWETYVNTGDWKLTIEEVMGKSTIPIMTIHKSLSKQKCHQFFIPSIKRSRSRRKRFYFDRSIDVLVLSSVV